MPDILHRFAIKASPADTYKALATSEGLAGWWTNQVEGGDTIGAPVKFRFADRGFIDMTVRELDPAKRVVWEVIDGPGEWIGTTIGFDLEQADDFTSVRFGHRGWASDTGFIGHCSMKWAMFMMSLKAFLETGRGAPFPNDVHISNMGD